MTEDIKLTKLSDCAGCGAKVGAGMLSKLLTDIKVNKDPRLIVGFDKSDDASVYVVDENTAIVQTVDFFPPIHDDPYTFGQIAAANALSDIYAMGGEPKLCQNILMIPKELPDAVVHELLRGGYDKVYEAGALITGGHSIFDPTLKYGLCVTGIMKPDNVLKNSGALPGDVLFLTKPLGTGILTTGAKGGLLSDEGMELAVALMTTLNKGARDTMIKYDVHARTDVTGFSLMGHLLEMAAGSDVSVVVDTKAVNVIPEALELASYGVLPEGMYRNRNYAEREVDAEGIDRAFCDALFDPQTSGGLLIAVSASDADALEAELEKTVPCAQRIGTVKTYNPSEKRIKLV